MQPSVTGWEFREPDEFREQMSGWDLEIVPLSRLELSWKQVAFDDIIIASHRVVGSFADASAVDAGWIFIVVCLAPTGTIWCGLEIEPGHLLIMAPGREHRSRIEEWQSLEIVISGRLAEQIGLLEGTLPRDFEPEQCVLPLDSAEVATFRALARSLDVPSALEAQLRECLMNAMRERTLEVLTSAVRRATERRALAAPPRRVARYDLAVRALAMMDAGGQHSPSIAELADRLGTSPRAIQYALKNSVGVGPHRYLLARRLHEVRRDLLHHRTSVTVAALDRGFENLSRFASQYARLFGEKPSTTLRRARAPIEAAMTGAVRVGVLAGGELAPSGAAAGVIPPALPCEPGSQIGQSTLPATAAVPRLRPDLAATATRARSQIG